MKPEVFGALQSLQKKSELMLWARRAQTHEMEQKFGVILFLNLFIFKMNEETSVWYGTEEHILMNSRCWEQSNNCKIAVSRFFFTKLHSSDLSYPIS